MSIAFVYNDIRICLFRKIVTKSYNEDIFRRTALYKIIGSFHLTVYAVIAKLSCHKMDLRHTFIITSDKVMPVKSGIQKLPLLYV